VAEKTAEPTAGEERILQGIIFPATGDLDVLPLYADRHGGGKRNAGSTVPIAIRERIDPDSPDAPQGREAVIPAGRRVSFATYFNAFPASYWRRWTSVTSVTLRLTLKGPASVVVYRSNARGVGSTVETIRVTGDGDNEVETTLPLDKFIDGGWYWFDIAAGNREVTLVDGAWTTTTDRQDPGRLSIGITTYNRPEFCVAQLHALGRARAVVDVLDDIYVIDQGTDRVRDNADFEAAAELLGEKLHVIEQPNLGGSGGFARTMSETLDAGRSAYLLLLDDDVVVEPESVVRAACFADLCRRPTIVGGHMFNLLDRSVLHAFGETVAPYTWWWGAAPHTKHTHDFSKKSLARTSWMHRRVDVDYNGWWMSLIPVQVIKEIGLSLPVFIKWDDAEYGLRARDAGFPTVSMPGVAIWHMVWDDKTDALDWQSYYHVRNRIVTALLHSPYDRGGRLVAELAEGQIQHLLSLQYSTARLRLIAIEDVMRGPEHLHAVLATKTPELRRLAAEFPDAQTAKDVEAFPMPQRRKPPRRARPVSSPKSPLSLALRAGLGAIRQLSKVDERALRRPEVELSHEDAAWWRLVGVDSAVVAAADGASAAWYRRDPRQYMSLLAQSAALHARLVAAWPELAENYRRAATDFTSAEAWRATFDPK
jgi:galactofuranosylgalactofuranosylrhamnosyl-N-acetylglucosaminyl-diphospho-decaprenol beta-1,5/1,6-galactofuranosyltransferase